MCPPAHFQKIRMTNPRHEEYTTPEVKNPDAVVQSSLCLPLALDLDREIPEDDIARTVIRAVEESGIIRHVYSGSRDSHGYRSIDMLKAVMLANTLKGSATLREMEEMCRNDIRFRLIFGDGATPSFMAFQRFIREGLGGCEEQMLAALNLYMKMQIPEHIDTGTECIDGTKEEADANKNTFVWRESSRKYHARCCADSHKILVKLVKLFNEEGYRHSLSVLRAFSLQYLMEACLAVEKYASGKGIEFVRGKGKRKTEVQRLYERLKDNAVKIWKYEMHFDILGDRGSFSKTDPDATFMHMKYDYYNHTNVFKPGYNVQMGSCSGFIWDILVSADGNDLRTYIPLMEQHFRNYGIYPERTPADGGYGCFDNYRYCREKGIGLYMKYSGYEKKKEKTTDKNRFKAAHFGRDAGGMPVCPAGHTFRVEKTRTETRGTYPREMETLVCDHCAECPFRNGCTKSKDGVRRIQRCRELEGYQEEVDRNLETDAGKELMNQRRIYSEGIFGDKKYNWDYDKMRRTGESGVKTEIYMYAYGRNLRRFHQIYTRQVRKARELVQSVQKYMPAVS